MAPAAGTTSVVRSRRSWQPRYPRLSPRTGGFASLSHERFALISDVHANSVLYESQDVAVRRHARLQCSVLSEKHCKTSRFVQRVVLSVGRRRRESLRCHKNFCELRRRLRRSAQLQGEPLEGYRTAEISAAGAGSPRVRGPDDAPATTPRASRGSTPSSRNTLRGPRDAVE